MISNKNVKFLFTLTLIFEALIAKYLIMKLKNQLSTKQHGFLGPSISTNSLIYTEHIVNVLKVVFVDSIYTDVSKAFDKVNLGLLLSKLSALIVSVSGRLLKLITSYLSDSSLHVKLNRFVLRVHGILRSTSGFLFRTTAVCRFY